MDVGGRDVKDLLRTPGFLPYLAAAVLARLAESALAVLLGITVYQSSGSVLALGWLGLIQAIPLIGLALFGGHVADRFDRRRLAIGLRLAMAGLVACMAAAFALAPGQALAVLYVGAFLGGVIHAFSEPALSGLEAQVVPVQHAVRAASVIGSTSRVFVLSAPVGFGFFYDWAGPAETYAVLAGLLALSSLILLLGVPARVMAYASGARPAMLANIAEGVRYVFSNQVLIASMALDLFAVFFGGMSALLPVFSEALGMGSAGVGMLRGAISAGGLLAMAATVRFPPRQHAGIILHLAVAGFGVGVIVFALSEVFWLSMLACFFVGLSDGVNMVIRHAIVRLAATDAMRGRVAAVRMVFINSTNEIGRAHV